MGERYDLVVIGSGPAGEKGAAQAAYFGKRVALVERSEHLGGAGINTGTIPSKTLRETALYFSGLRQRGLYGIDYCLRDGLTIADFMHRKQKVIETERSIVSTNLARHRIEVIRGDAMLKDAHTVQVSTPGGGILELQAEIILIAAGSHPHHPPHVHFDHRLVYDSDSILSMSRIPGEMAVIGGGVIGVEYASVFAALGVRVTLVEKRERLLSFVDSEIAGRLRSHLEKIGVRFRFSDYVQSADTAGGRTRLSLGSGVILEPDIALFAAGRESNVDGLGLESVGIEVLSRGVILVNDKFQTRVPNIYAAGDVLGFPALASVSMEQARVAMVHAFDLKYKEHVSPVIPLAVYAIPEIAMAGLTEEACSKDGVPCEVGRAYYEANARGQIIGDTSGMLKLVFSPADKKVLGVHLIGEGSSELVHIGAHVMGMGGTIDSFIHAVYNYPTLSEAYKYAAYDALGKLAASGNAG
ncbi:MAG: Si-specific NAD(P)(+) transhydrogenase [Acidobacteriota bacterium]